MVTWQQQSTKSSTKDVNLGTITDTLSRYKFSPLSGIRVKPKLHRRRRRIYESSYSRRRTQKLFIRTFLLEFGKYCEEFSWHHRTTTLHKRRDNRNCRTSCTSNEKKRHQPYYCKQGRMISSSGIPWNAVAICERTENQNERRFGESFQDMLCSREEFGEKIFWLLRLENWIS